MPHFLLQRLEKEVGALVRRITTVLASPSYYQDFYAFCRPGKLKAAIDHLKRQSTSVNNITYASILRVCGKLKALDAVKQVHEQIIRNGLEGDRLLANHLVDVYGRCGKLEDSRAVFNAISFKNVFSCNAMIAAYVEHGSGDDALQLFWQMQLEGVKPDKSTFAIVFSSLYRPQYLAQIKVVHALCNNMGTDSDVIVGTSLINLYGKHGMLEDTHWPFDRIMRRNVVTWTAIITCYVHNGFKEASFKLFRQMQLEDVQPDNFTFASLLSGCLNPSEQAEGKFIHACTLDSPFDTDAVVKTALVNMYGKCGSLNSARNVFDNIRSKNVSAYNAIMAAYAQNNCGKECLQLFQVMYATKLKPDKFSFVSSLDACSGLAALQSGEEIHTQVLSCGLESDTYVGTALVNMYGKCGKLETAQSIFEKMHEHNIVSWNALIAITAQNGHGKVAIGLFERMRREGFKPNKVTFIHVLSASSHAGLLSEGEWYFISIHQAYGITPCLEHFGCMADHLGRSGLLSEAEELIYSMPWQSNPMMWIALLAACRLRGHLEQGKRIAQNLLDLGSKDAVTYVLLRHIHAAAGGWHHENLDKAVEEEKKVCSLSIEQESEDVQFLIDINCLLHGLVRKDVIYYNE